MNTVGEVRSTVDVLTLWHSAVNAGDIEAAVSLCADDVGVQGPRGVGNGRDLVRAWLTRSGIRLHPQEPFIEGDGRVVVHELAHWTTAEATQTTTPVPVEPTDTWCVFTVREGLVASIARFETRDQVPRA